MWSKISRCVYVCLKITLFMKIALSLNIIATIFTQCVDQVSCIWHVNVIKSSVWHRGQRYFSESKMSLFCFNVLNLFYIQLRLQKYFCSYFPCKQQCVLSGFFLEFVSHRTQLTDMSCGPGTTRFDTEKEITFFCLLRNEPRKILVIVSGIYKIFAVGYKKYIWWIILVKY